MKARQIIRLLSLLTCGVGLIPSQAHAELPDDASARCTALRSTDLSRVPDAPTLVIATVSVEPRGDTAAYRQVNGYVAPTRDSCFASRPITEMESSLSSDVAARAARPTISLGVKVHCAEAMHASSRMAATTRPGAMSCGPTANRRL